MEEVGRLIRTRPRRAPARVLQSRAGRQRLLQATCLVAAIVLLVGIFAMPLLANQRTTLVRAWWALAAAGLCIVTVQWMSLRRLRAHAKEAAQPGPRDDAPSKVPVDFDRAWREGVQ